MNEISTADGGGRYEIRLKGHLDTRWADWFDGLTLTRCSDGTTAIRGLVVDQSALHGLLQRVRDLGPAVDLRHPGRIRSPHLRALLAHQSVGSVPAETAIPHLCHPASIAEADARPPRQGRQTPLIPPSPQQPMPGCRWRNKEGFTSGRAGFTSTATHLSLRTSEFHCTAAHIQTTMP